eukprot:m.35231 g.35231  ORF g.35231 m.35231 type:complete len:185 (-) comp14393_c0_seq2:973-1527(-)
MTPLNCPSFRTRQARYHHHNHAICGVIVLGNAEDTCNLKSKNASKQASKQAARANRDAARRQKAEIKMLRKHAPDMLHEELHARASDRARVPNRPDSAACSDGPSGGLGRTLSRKSSPLVAVSSASTGTEAVSERASDDNTVPNDVHATGKTPSLLRRYYSFLLTRGARGAESVRTQLCLFKYG